MKKKSCFLCGIGGSGMSALALLLLGNGWTVSGSDRSRDRGETPEKFSDLEKKGIRLHPQDGSGLRDGIDLLIVSSAVEDSIPDVREAKEKNIPIRKRAEVLAELFNAAQLSIAIGGTSGKSTVTAMTGWILYRAGLNPTIVNGAHMASFGGENAVIGDRNLFVAEVDESDGSIALFRPSIAVLTNISLDHKPMDELKKLFGDFTAKAVKAVIREGGGAYCFSLDDPAAQFHARDITPMDDGVSFTAGNAPVRLRVPGRHNGANALAAMAAAHAAGVDIKVSAAALADYRGIGRRFEVIGTARGVTVIDDFAHNPDKIAATLRTLHEKPGRVWAIFQPHGFGPTKLMRADLVEALAANMRNDDVLLMPEIYFAGGTAVKDISSNDIIADVAARGIKAKFFEKRKDIISYLAGEASSGDRVIIMGARDDTLPLFGKDILVAMDRSGRT